MKIIVTGGAGFIGSAFCRHIISEKNDTILNIDKLTYAADLRSLSSVAENARYRFLKADICDRQAMDSAFDVFRPDAVIHLAAESHVDRSIAASDQFIQTNIIGTYTLLESARAYWSGLGGSRRGGFRFLQVSTDEVYGSLGAEGLFREDTPINPSSPYSASKAASDCLVMAWHKTYGFPGLISNCSNNYGPYQFPEKLIPTMILNAWDGKPLPVYGDGSNIRDWLYIDDHVRALYTILVNGRTGENYNVGGNSERSNIQVVEQICEFLDRELPQEKSRRSLISFVEDRPGHDQRYAIDATRIEQQLGWRALESFNTGLKKTVHWYLENEAWWKPMLRRRA